MQTMTQYFCAVTIGHAMLVVSAYGSVKLGLSLLRGSAIFSVLSFEAPGRAWGLGKVLVELGDASATTQDDALDTSWLNMHFDLPQGTWRVLGTAKVEF